MKIKFKNQKEQNEAVKAVVDVFEGQPNLQNSYLMDTGIIEKEESLSYFDYDKSAWGNQKLISELTDDKILENIKNIQYNNNLPPSDRIERRVGANGYNITVEMETGVGKTFTYIKLYLN